MPTYEYKCEKGHTFDKEQRITDKPLKVCPIKHNPGSNTCDVDICSAPVKRIIGKTSFILKGGGWFRDGY